MERKIGEIFEYNGEWYQCIKSPDGTCMNCDMNFDGKCPIPLKECVESGRSDKSYVIFKKLEKVGEPYEYSVLDKGIVMLQPYKLFITPIINWVVCNVHYDTNTIDLEIKQNKEDMEEKELTYEELLHYYHSTVGLWAIDRNPQEVHFDWICKNAFQLGMEKILSNSESIGNNLKPFDLEAAKAGKPVCTKDGRKAIFFAILSNKNFPVVAIVNCGQEENVYQYDINGVCDEHDTNLDLTMLPEKKEGWVNVYRDCDGASITKDDNIYSSKEAAMASAQMIDRDNYVATTIIKWEG